jgi:hypothetical protein
MQFQETTTVAEEEECDALMEKKMKKTPLYAV